MQLIDRLKEYSEVVYKDDLYLRDLIKELNRLNYSKNV